MKSYSFLDLDDDESKPFNCYANGKRYSTLQEAGKECANLPQEVIDCAVGEIPNKDSVIYSFGLHVALACAQNIPRNVKDCLNEMVTLKNEEVRTLNLLSPYETIMTETQMKKLNEVKPDGRRIRDELRTGEKEVPLQLANGKYKVTLIFV